MSANQDIADGVIAHRVKLLRVEGGVVSSLLQAYERAVAPIFALLRSATARPGSVSPDVLRRARYALDDAVADLYDRLRAELGAAVAATATAEATHAARLLRGALPASLGPEAPPALAGLVAAVVDPPGGQRWRSTLAADLVEQRERIQAVVGEVERSGGSIPEAKRLLKQATSLRETYRDRLTVIARTEVQRAAADASLLTYRASSDVVGRVQWLATLDSRTCLRCAPLHGRTWPLDGPHPVPPLHPRCRCALAPVTRSWEALGLGRTPQLDGEPAAEMDFEAWLRRQQVATQQSILGPTRHALWRSGQVTLAEFADTRAVLPLSALSKEGA